MRPSLEHVVVAAGLLLASQPNLAASLVQSVRSLATPQLSTAVSSIKTALVPPLSFDLSAQDVSGGAFVPLDTVQYSLQVQNNGGNEADDVVISQPLPVVYADYVPGSETTTQGTVSVAGGNLVAVVGTLAAGDSAAVTVNVRLKRALDANTLVSSQAALTSSITAGSLLSDDPATGAAEDPTVFTTSTADSDGDGLSDSYEVEIGTDPTDADSDDDGVPDGAEVQWASDSDGDGLINALDADSDNDGLFDGTEMGYSSPVASPGPGLSGTNVSAGHYIPDGDAGATVTAPLLRDTDGGGVLDGLEDANHNGVQDLGETNPTAGHGGDDNPSLVPDTDGDGLSDQQERAAGTDPNDIDSDDDGVSDGAEPNGLEDSDGDGLINALDVDSDNDGILDGTELRVVTPARIDGIGDPSSMIRGTNLARHAFVSDADPSTGTDATRSDSDHGGMRDGAEDFNHNGRVDPNERDPNNASDDLNLPVPGISTDGDSDGLPDAEEQAAGTDPADADSDDDGVLDGAELHWNVDTDGDGLINAVDADSDNDSLFDGTEMGVTGTPRGTNPSRGTYIPDADPGSVTNPLVRDTDGGGVIDGIEDINHNGRVENHETNPTLGHGADDPSNTNKDTDGDGLADIDELVHGTDATDSDSDDDGVADGSEPDWQLDSDGDGLINARDPDSDNDGLFDGTELSRVAVDAGIQGGTQTARRLFAPDADPSTYTRATVADTDGGGVSDAHEDANHNGRVDPGETDPTQGHAADDPNASSLDSDGDGLLDAEELAFGSNPNDADSDDDGLPDGAEPLWNSDSDGDGALNVLDSDSDNDGLFDGTETGHDCRGPGTQALAGHCLADADPATVTNPLLRDSDNGGVRDGAEDVNHNGRVDGGETNPNFELDDNAQAWPDSDGDGLLDVEELAAHSNPRDADSDDDGVVDGSEANWQDDSDGDGLLNVLDVDSDNDGLFDGTEMGLGCGNPATNMARHQCVPDADLGATVTNPLAVDTDGGGVADGTEDINHDGRQQSGETNPTQGHAADDADANVLDSDGDGLPDVVERSAGTNPNDADTDDDGVMDGAELNWCGDADGDGLINARDADSDNDGLYDGTEMSLDCSNPATHAAAHHCIADAQPTTHTHPLIADTDGGLVVDGEEDFNHNGRLDPGETDPTVGHAADDNPTGILDRDHDGLSDNEEIAAGTLPNDADSDDDGVLDGAEPNWQEDSDGDGLINALDADSDNDGLYDGTELGLNCANPATNIAAGHCVPDGDGGRSVTDPLDADSDGGGVSDGSEDTNKNGGIDPGETNPTRGHGADDNPAGRIDSDHDGLTDAEEVVFHLDPEDADSDDDGILDGAEPNWRDDADGDGWINALDFDSDGDGVFDGTEVSVQSATAATNTRLGFFIADADPNTSTLMLKADSDGGGVSDGREDINKNGRVDAGETNPTVGHAADDASTPVTDTDLDGLTDAEESLFGTDPTDADSDDDGLPDGEEPAWFVDVDGDGLISALDVDSDNDGLYDGTERGHSCASPGTDAAANHCIADADPSTMTDPSRLDTDRGGVRDGGEDVNHNGRVDLGETNPNLGHGADDNPTGLDDADKDGLPFNEELYFGTNPNDADSDNDGVADGAEANWQDDTDGDGLINALDADSDGDGLYDGTEISVTSGVPDPDGDGPLLGTDVSQPTFVPDSDPNTHTVCILADTDHGGVVDGTEDSNHNGRVDPGERNPNNPLDDHTVSEGNEQSWQGVLPDVGVSGGGGCTAAPGSSLGVLAALLQILRLRRRRYMPSPSKYSSGSCSPAKPAFNVA